MSDRGLFSLAGEVAVVIGGGGVLGGAMATGLAQAGADVVILGRSKESADARAREIEELGRNAMGIACDATSKAGLQQALETVIARFGHVDILVNAAGVNSGTPFFEITEAEWHRILDIDLTGVFLACQVFGKAMVDAGRGGAIINISSASSGPPLSKVFTYAVAKAGVNQITQFLARELAPHNIRVNAILPGFFPAEQNRKLLTAGTGRQHFGPYPDEPLRGKLRTGGRYRVSGVAGSLFVCHRIHPQGRRRFYRNDHLAGRTGLPAGPQRTR